MRGAKDDYFWQPEDFFPNLLHADEDEEEPVIDDAAIDQFWSKAVGTFGAFGGQPQPEDVSA